MNPPPRLARILMRLVVPARDRTYVEQDLAEEFAALLKRGIPHRDATRWYWRQVLRSILPSVTRRRTRPAPTVARADTMAGTVRDIRLGLRSLLRAPGFTALAIFTLALGVGGTSAIFSVVHGVLLQPLPYEEPDQLVSVWHSAPPRGWERLNQTFATYVTYRDENRVFDQMSLWDWSRASVAGAGEPEQVRVLLVTWEFLSLLGVEPILGRDFTIRDDRPGAPRTVLLTFGYWQRTLGGDPSVLGQSVNVDGEPAVVIGMLPESFRFQNDEPGILTLFQLDPSAIRGVGGFSYQAIARLRPEVTVEAANEDLDRLLPVAVERYPAGSSMAELESMGMRSNVQPLKADVIGDIGDILWIVFASVGLVFAIACANVAALFLVRAEDRRAELAVRAALGAGRAALIRQFLAEGLVLAVPAGLAGLALAAAGIKLLVAIAPRGFPRLTELSIDGTVAALTMGIAVIAGLTFSSFPVLLRRRLDLARSIREAGRGAPGGRQGARAQRALVISQLALALVLLASTGLLVRSIRAMLNVPPGFERPEELLAFRITIPEADTPDIGAAAGAHEQILQRVAAIPGVTSAALASSVTMDRWDENDLIFAQDQLPSADQLPPSRQLKWISPEYFETMGNPVLVGRTVSWADIRTGAPVVVVTAAMARSTWGDPSTAIGKRISTERTGPWFEVVGVVGDVHDDGVLRPPTPIVYWPMIVRNMYGRPGLFAQRSMGYAVRSSRVGDPGLVTEIRSAVSSVDPTLPVWNVATLEELRRAFMALTSFTLVLLGIAAGVAVSLSLVGVYGIVSYVVAARTREIGVRMALGASQSNVGRLVLRQGATLAGAAVTVGLAMAAVATRLMRGLLFNVQPVDPLTYLGVALALVAVTLCATWRPARRAARVDPVRALRTD